MFQDEFLQSGIVLDVFSGSVHSVDDLAYDIINLYEKESKEK